MSLVNKLRTDISFDDVTTGRNRSMSAEYAIFLRNCATGVAGFEPGVILLVECPKDRVHLAEVAKSWVSSLMSNVKNRSKKEGVIVKVKQVTSESDTGLGVAILFVGKAPEAQA